ncbi:endothelial lipase [Anabrus simplex]|uniref:endothelial lipase n=1 Tax=Anabrus simplex TaxID=316456 RepID=UPI0035A371CD
MRATFFSLLLIVGIHEGCRSLGEQAPSRTPRLVCVPDIAMPFSCQNRRSFPRDEVNRSSLHSSRIAVESEDVTFILFTRRTSGSPKELTVGDIQEFDKSTYNTSAKTKIIIHGYFSSGKEFEHIAYAYLTAGDYNVIIVDWSSLSKWCYCEYVLYRIEGVGLQVGRLLDFLVFRGVKLRDIHLVGHSLGSHVAGVASRSCSAGRIGRITGLDPARPGFASVGQNDRLNRKCADFVDVIHTCAEVMGIEEPMGHADFYPNGGKSPQPGCNGITKELCSHSRAHFLFAESITTDVGFVAQQCDNWHQYTAGFCSNITTRMGERIDQKTASGMYFLRTGSSCPFYIISENGAGTVTSSLVLLILLLPAIFNTA